MPLIRLSGEALGRYTRVFRTPRGLQNLEKVKANRLLDFDSGPFGAFNPDVPHTDITAAPEIVHILLLGIKQILEPPGRHPIHCPLSAAAEIPLRHGLGGMIDHIFGEAYWRTRPGFDGEGDLTEIVRVDHLMG